MGNTGNGKKLVPPVPEKVQKVDISGATRIQTQFKILYAMRKKQSLRAMFSSLGQLEGGRILSTPCASRLS
eukprot:g4270.t1